MNSALEERKSKECVWAGEVGVLPLFPAAISGTKLLVIVSCGVFQIALKFYQQVIYRT